MKIFGIDFDPLDTPIQQRLQLLAVGAWLLTVIFGGVIGTFFLIFLLFTRLWWFTILYTTWVYFDRHTSEKGGRPIKWIQNLKWWQYMHDYYSTKLILAPDFTLDQNKNYLFACFPHGVLPVAPYNAIGSQSSPFHKLYPHFIVKTSLLGFPLLMPFVRELGLALECISCSAKSLNFVLSKKEGGQIVILWPGGAMEAYYGNPGQFKVFIKRRKGFVKIALETGAPLVPVVTFGECDLFEQVEGPNIKRFQELIRRTFGFTPIIFNGRGILQNSFGIFPRRVPMTTVVGSPIKVTKVQNPSNEEVEELHQKFLKELTNLFEKYKYEFVKDPQNTFLEFV